MTEKVTKKIQEAFNKVWNHFVIEGHELGYNFDVLDGPSPAYISDKGKCCAVGVLMNRNKLEALLKETPYSNRSTIKKLYSEDFSHDKTRFRDLIEVQDFDEPEVEAYIHFLDKLQDVHDDVVIDSVILENEHLYLQEKLETLADQWNLEIPKK